MESFVAALVMALVVFVVSVLVLRRVTMPAGLVRLAGRLPSRPRTVFSPDEVRRQATGLLNRLADELGRTNPAEVDGDLYERAGLARSEAERALDSSRLTEVIGALALARSGLDDLRAAAGRSHVRYQPCFFNPLHAQATTQVDDTIGAGTVSVRRAGAARPTSAGAGTTSTRSRATHVPASRTSSVTTDGPSSGSEHWSRTSRRRCSGTSGPGGRSRHDGRDVVPRQAAQAA